MRLYTCYSPALSVLLILILLILTATSLSAEQTGVIIPNMDKNKFFPLYDSANYLKSDMVLKEGSSDKICYIKRPFGYIESREDSTVNLSIIKTYIDRISSEKAYIKGEIKNLDDKIIDTLVITFNLFNSNGEQIGNAYASIDYLEPKKTWKFSTDPIIRSDFQFERYASIYAGVFH